MKHPDYRKRAKITGKGKGNSFLRLPHYILDSQQFAALSPIAVKWLLEVARQFKGANNGDLSMPWSLLKRRGWASQWTAKRARDELLAAEFIWTTRHGGKHLCALYAITWEPVNECKQPLEVAPEKVASNAWRKNPCSHHGINSPEIAATTASIAA